MKTGREERKGGELEEGKVGVSGVEGVLGRQWKRVGREGEKEVKK